MTRCIVRNKEAEQDLMDIWCYIAPENMPAADKLLREIDDKCALLAHFPNMGQARHDISDDLRHFPVGRYLILYRITEQTLEVVRVIHTARRL